MADTFQNYPNSLSQPATDAFDVAVGVTLDPTPRALYVGTGGSLTVQMLGGGTVTFAGVPSGSILPVRVSSVTSVVDAADIVGLV